MTTLLFIYDYKTHKKSQKTKIYNKIDITRKPIIKLNKLSRQLIEPPFQ